MCGQRGQSRAVSVEHYENFPVASVLCPPALRPAIVAIYGFARTADDLADEGDAPPTQRLAELAAFRADLMAVVGGAAPSPRWARVFERLRAAITQYKLPINLLTDLLSAFEQDVVKVRYADRPELLDYCRRSANPVGRLLLHLYRVDDAASLRQSDAICTALQLANFWQDFGVDVARGRLYPPQTDCIAAAAQTELLMQGQDSPAAHALIASLVRWTRDLMREGAPLVHNISGRGGWELRFVVQGGLRILDKIAALDHATLTRRPTIVWTDGPLMLWRALAMRRAQPIFARPLP
jgi:hydroxysqualene synthase